MMAAVTAVWAAASSTYTLAVRAGSPILSILPPVALVAFADIVLEDGVRPFYAGLFLLAALAVVFTDGLRRIRQWGPIWSGSRRDHTLRTATSRGVRRVALVALGAALVVPWILPGFRSQALVDFSGSNDAVRLDPFVSIHASLNRDHPIDLFRVTTEGPRAYWRVVALDDFDGSTWSMSDPSLEDAQEYTTPARLPAGFPTGSDLVEQQVEVLSDLGDRLIPMAYPAEFLDVPTDQVRYDDGVGAAEAPDPLQQGTTYRVDSRRVLPTPAQLDAVTFGSRAEYGQYTFIPGDVPPSIDDLAHQWAAGKPTPYRQVLAIQQHLLDPSFTYSQDPPPATDANALVDFLTVSKTGFCQQFATTMAVLVRELGYPSRVAIGYKPGDLGNGSYVVSTNEAHAWVEVLFPGYGWLPFEPTPGTSSPLADAGGYLNPVKPTKGAAGDPRGQPGGVDGGLVGPIRGLPPKLAGMERLEGRRSGALDLPGVTPSPTAGDTGPSYSIPYGLLLAIALAALGAVLVLTPIVKAAWRFRVLHRHREPREMVLAAYRVFDGEAADLGLGRSRGETLTEYRDRIGAAVRFSDGHLATLTGVATRAAYSPDPVAPEEAVRAARAAHVAIKDMRRSAGIVRRITGIYRPGL
jgi:transglutaminase-like putative cysteine protease